MVASHDVKVDKNGEFEKYNITVNTSSMVYSMLNSMSKEDKGKSLKDIVTENGRTYEEVWDGDNVQIKTSGIGSDKVTIEKTDDYIVYRDIIGDSGESGTVQIHYYLEMPNEIIESNADSVKGKKAEWHMTDFIRDIYAKCENPSFDG